MQLHTNRRNQGSRIINMWLLGLIASIRAPHGFIISYHGKTWTGICHHTWETQVGDIPFRDLSSHGCIMKNVGVKMGAPLMKNLEFKKVERFCTTSTKCSATKGIKEVDRLMTLMALGCNFIQWWLLRLTKTKKKKEKV